MDNRRLKVMTVNTKLCVAVVLPFIQADLVVLTASGSGLDRPPPQEFLSAYENSLNLYLQARFDVKTRTTYSGPAKPSGAVLWESNYKIWRDHEKWRYVIDETYTSPKSGKPQTARNTNEWFYPGKGFICILNNANGGGIGGVVARLEELPESERLRIGAFDFSVVINGYMNGNQGALLPDILRESRLTASQDPETGLEVLKSEGAWGTHVVWLDPKKSHLPRRIEQHKGPEDWFDGRDKLLKRKPAFSSRLYPKARLKEYHQTFEVTRFERIEDTDVPTECTITAEMRFSDGQTVTLKTEAAFSNVKLNPNFSAMGGFTPGNLIPDGTPVQVDDHPNIEYEWYRGEIVKHLDKNTVSGLAGNFFLRGDPTRRVLFFVALAVLAAIAGLLIYLRSRKKSSRT